MEDSQVSATGMRFVETDELREGQQYTVRNGKFGQYIPIPSRDSQKVTLPQVLPPTHKVVLAKNSIVDE